MSMRSKRLTGARDRRRKATRGHGCAAQACLPDESYVTPASPGSAAHARPAATDHLRETLAQGFANRPTLNFAEAAKYLKIDRKLLRRLVDQGKVPCRITGTGRVRLRREFTLSDIETFYANAAVRPACTPGARPIARVQTAAHVRGSFLADRSAAKADRKARREADSRTSRRPDVEATISRERNDQ